MELSKEIMQISDGKFPVLWDACSLWVEGQGQEHEWQGPIGQDVV